MTGHYRIFAGFDVGDPANAIPMNALPGTQWHDVMTYCNFQWLSAYTYLGIRRRLAAEDALGPDGAPAPAPASAGPASRGVGYSGGGGRPDQRFPHERLRKEVRPEITVSVVATVNLTRRTGKIQHVNPLERPRFRKQAGQDARLRVKGPDGQSLAEIPVAVRLDSELSPGDDRKGIVDAIISVDPTARAIELVVEDQTVDTYRLGGPLPGVRALRANAGPKSIGIAADADETEGTYSVQVSTDAGRTWQTVGIGLKTPSLELDRSQFKPGQKVRVRVIATNGLQRSVIMTDTFKI